MGNDSGDPRWSSVAFAASTHYAFAALATLAAFALRMALAEWLRPPYLLFYPTVMLAGMLWGLGPGLLTTGMSAVLAEHWVIPSMRRGAPTTQDLVGLAAFAAMGVFMTAVAALYRRARREIARQHLERELHESGERSRRREDEALRRYELLAANTRDVILFVRRDDGAIIDANAAAVAAYGYTAEELRALTLHDLRATESPDETARVMAGVDRGALRFEAVHRRRDGTTFPVEVSAQGATLGDARVLLGVVRDITARTRAEQALRESEARYRAIFEQAAVGVSLVERRTGRFLQVNGPLCEMLGRSREELLARTWRDVTYPEDAGGNEEGVRRMHETGAVYRAEKRYVRKDGSSFWASVTVKPVALPGETATTQVAVIEDITERKRAEADARRRRALEAQFAQVAESVPGVIFSIRRGRDGVGSMPFATREVEDLYGLSREVLARGMVEWAANLHPEDLPRVYAVVDESARRLSRWHDVFRYRHPAKGERWIEGWATPNRDADGSTVWHGYFRDVTDQVQADRALQDSERRFRALIEKANDIILVLDGEGRYTFWSQSAVAILGWTAAEKLGRFALEMVHEEDQPRVAGLLQRLLGTPGETARDTLRYRHKDGSWRLIEATARNLLDDPAVRGVIVNSRDITSQRRLEEQFRQAQKLESIGRLAGGIAHDFNNLLTVILSCSAALKEDLERGTAPRPEDVEEIDAAGGRARDLTRQLLAFARKQIIAPVHLDLNAVVRGSQKMLARLVGEDVALRVDLQPGPWTLHADPGQLEQILLNLVVNARDAMPAGGTLSIETRNVSVDGEEAGSDATRIAGDWVRLVVRDTGSGMSPEVRSHLFEPFFTTKEPGKGTGLGLATVYGIVQQAAGHMHVTSEVGRGTTFDVCFPRVKEARATPAVAPPGAPEAAAGGVERILVVEDDPQVRGVTVRTLRTAGYDVLSVSHPQEALDLVPGGGSSRIHLLVTDVVMPMLDGRALAAEMCRRHPGLRVLYLSGYPLDAIAAHGVLNPGVEFLAKPFTGPTLLGRVRSILDASEGGAAPPP